MEILQTLKEILIKNKNKRICVIGTTCIGKTTLLNDLPECLDMDDLLFPLLTKEEKEFICQDTWTEEIGDAVDRLAKERIKIEKGRPVFGTVLLDCDLIIFLEGNEQTLRERAISRNEKIENILAMQKSIKDEINKTKIQVIQIQI